MAERLLSMRRVRPLRDEDSADSLVRSRAINSDSRARGQQVLMEAQLHNYGMYRYRRDRLRSKRYTFGDQWGDIICVDGEKMTEEEYIKRQGNIPLKTNLIRRLVRNVVGVYRSDDTEPVCIARDREEQQQAETMSVALQYNMQLNHMREMYARTLEEYLIGGLVAHKKRFCWRNGKMDNWTDYVQPDNIILDNNMRDLRGWDCTFIGEIHDVSYGEMCEQLAKSPSDYVRLAEIYKAARNQNGLVTYWNEFGYSRDHVDTDFLMPKDESRCRIIEVWRKESKPRYRCRDYNSGELYKIDIEDYDVMVAAENASRLQRGTEAGMEAEDIPLIKAEWFIDSYWYYYILSPFGDIIDEGESPFAHGSHPYVFKAYPFLDGEIHSFVSDVLDQQRYTNRLIVMQDFIIRASAKGALLVPEDCLKGQSPEDFADSWAKFNGVIVYTPSKSGVVPQQVSANSTNIGLHEMLSLQLKFFEDISGVNAALQGKASFSGESGSHAELMAQNASVSLIDILQSFQDFTLDAAYKDIKNIQQFYDHKKTLSIVGGKAVVYDPQKIRNIEVDISIQQSKASPVYRNTVNDFLIKLFEMQAISLEQMLQIGKFDFGDELLQNIQSQKQQLENGQMPEGLSPELAERAHQGANQQAVEQLYGAMRGAA